MNHDGKNHDGMNHAGTNPQDKAREQALENTRKLLEEKQAQARQAPAWQALDEHAAGGAPKSGFQSDGARVQADQLHDAEMRLEGNQGSSSTHDRHNQGKRDQRT